MDIHCSYPDDIHIRIHIRTSKTDTNIVTPISIPYPIHLHPMLWYMIRHVHDQHVYVWHMHGSTHACSVHACMFEMFMAFLWSHIMRKMYESKDRLLKLQPSTWFNSTMWRNGHHLSSPTMTHALNVRGNVHKLNSPLV